MVKINGIELHAIRNATSSDGYNLRFASLYLDGEKIASAQLEKKGSDGKTFVQLFMMYGYSEAALRALLAENDLTPELFMDQYQWLSDMESQYNGRKSGAFGVACMQHAEGNITMGIPARLAGCSEEDILKELQYFIDRNELQYGPCSGYALFLSPNDFSRGTPISLDAIRA